MVFSVFPVLLLLVADPARQSAALDLGYRQMYDLQFVEAHKTFAGYAYEFPSDPVGPASNAAAYLFAEMDRLRILQSEFFVDDNSFRNPKKLSPDAAVRQVFDAEIARAGQLSYAVLRTAPQDRNALFASILATGLRADYDGLIDKRYLSALSSVKNGRIAAEKLLAIDPMYYDAHLAIGVENYMLSLKALPIRWFLRMAGAEVDRDKGLQKLRLTAESGHYLKPYARLLLAVAALRDMDRATAKQILGELSVQFPHNRLYREELARLE